MPPPMTRIISPATLRAKHVGYVLPNGVRCVIVQDANAKLPAAAMSIAAGQLNDPPQLPGLAHFCEHMLFMGTEKFPKEDEYDSYISKSNGFNNAFTADQATVYYFQVSDAALEGALERFVEFFVAPMFNESAVHREVQAVHSEDEKNHSVDYWRSDEVFRGMYNEKHPRSRYGNGNETTLVEEPKQKGLSLRDELKAFYTKNYAAEAACIAVYSAREPESVLKLIEEPLLRMRPGKGPAFHFIPENEGLFKPAVLGSWMNLRTVKKTRGIRVQWPVKSASSLWKSMPSAYISHVLGHECDSSVLGVLKQRDWATAMTAGAATRDNDFELFYVVIALTVEGFRHIPEVVELIYEYVGLAVNNGVNKDVYTQMKAEERLSFESQEISSPSSHCVTIAQNTSATDLEHCFVGGSCILEDNVEAALGYATQLIPDNAQVTLMWGSLPSNVADAVEAAEKEDDEVDDADDAEGEVKEEEGDEAASPEALFAALPPFAQKPADTLSRFHKTQYSEMRIPEEQLAAWRNALANPRCPDLKLPSTNPFIATDFTVFPSASSGDVEPAPEAFHSPHGITMVKKDAGHHRTFKCAVAFNIISPVAYGTALQRFYMQVMSSILQDSLTELSYYGELASLENTLTRDAGGPGFFVSGPYQQVPAFFAKLLDYTLRQDALKGSKGKFDTYKEQYIRSMEGRASNQPYEHAIERLGKVVTLVNYTFEDLLAAAPAATYDGYTAFVDEFLKQGLLFECFIAGNLPSPQDMIDSVVSTAEQKLNSLGIPVVDKTSLTRFRDSLDFSSPGGAPVPASAPGPILTTLDAISLPPFNPEDPNVSTMLNIYIGKTDARTCALGSVAAKLFSSLFFNALRTKESLGYVVFSQFRPISRGSHIVFLAQSAVAGVDGVYLLSRIVAFLSALEDSMDRLCTEAELRKITGGLIQGLEKLPDSVSQEASRLQGDYHSPMGLDNRKDRVHELKALTVADVKEFFKHYVFNSRTNARALALVVNSSRTIASDPLTSDNRQGQSGSRTKRIQLPPKRTSTVESAEGESAGAASNGEEELQLPGFDIGEEEGACIEVTVIEGIAAYRKNRPILRDTTF